MVSEYEKRKALNMQKNVELLKSLGLDKPLFEPREKVKQPSKKRKTPDDTDKDDAPVPVKTLRLEPPPAEAGVRRSSRNIGKSTNCNDEQLLSSHSTTCLPGLKDASVRRPETMQRKYGPKTFGPIPGVAVGSWWETRAACSRDSIHAPWVGGIAPGPDGAYSVALSGGYDDDVDLGYAFTYTGSGGRDLKGTEKAPKNLRTAPQSFDQSFENLFNKALKRSAETRNPIRVIRGFKVKSPYAPSQGYRYDGLYMVEQAWIEKGLSPQGHLVCKYAFKRIAGQPPLPVRDMEENGTEENEAAQPSNNTSSAERASPSVDK